MALAKGGLGISYTVAVFFAGSRETREYRYGTLFGTTIVLGAVCHRLQQGGHPVSALREANVDDDASAYCVYDSRNRKVEMDVFYPAGDDVGGAKGPEKTVRA